jgi:hypothetical protein
MVAVTDLPPRSARIKDQKIFLGANGPGQLLLGKSIAAQQNAAQPARKLLQEGNRPNWR